MVSREEVGSWAVEAGSTCQYIRDQLDVISTRPAHVSDAQGRHTHLILLWPLSSQGQLLRTAYAQIPTPGELKPTGYRCPDAENPGSSQSFLRQPPYLHTCLSSWPHASSEAKTPFLASKSTPSPVTMGGKVGLALAPRTKPSPGTPILM